MFYVPLFFSILVCFLALELPLSCAITTHIMPAQLPSTTPDEITPLFHSTAPAAKNIRESNGKPWVPTVVLLLATIAFIDISAFVSAAPRTRIYEANECTRYYQAHDPTRINPDGTVSEANCKINTIQQRLAIVYGWQDALDSVPGLVLALPFGALADRCGRKWIFTAALMGVQMNAAWVVGVCYLGAALQWTWVSTAFYFVGGGPMVAVAVVMTMLADVTPPRKKTAVFLYATAVVLVCEIVGPLLASKLMQKGDWLPLFLSLGVQQVGVVVSFFCPETLKKGERPEPRENSVEDDRARVADKAKKELVFGLRAQMQSFKDAFGLLRSNGKLILVMFSYVGYRSGSQATQLLVRYASKRYNWEIKKAALFLSFRAATNLVAVIVFIPGVNSMILRYVPSRQADVWLARGSAALLSAAFLLVGLASSPVLLIISLCVYNLGTGYTAALRSISIHIVGQSSPDVGKLMSLLAITESIGLLLSGLTINQLFTWGMDMGSNWLGLPFLVVSCLHGLMTLVAFIIEL